MLTLILPTYNYIFTKTFKQQETEFIEKKKVHACFEIIFLGNENTMHLNV